MKHLFPEELLSTIDPSDRGHVKKTLHISTRTRLDKLLANEDDEDRAGGEEDVDLDDADKNPDEEKNDDEEDKDCLLYTSPSPRD